MSHASPPLAGRVVVVTGTSRGIGVGLVRGLAEAGARVVGASRSEPEWEPPGDDVYAHLRHDVVADPPQALLAAALERFGRVDGLVNNAAIEHYGDCWSQSDEELDEMLAVNLTAPFALSQEVARHWVEHGEPGAIVNICSVEAEVGWPEPGQAAYAVTKGGLLGVTRALALDLARHGIRVVAIGPGAIETEMAPGDRSYAKRIPLGRAPGTPEDVAGAAVYLLSDAASYVTGQILYVDGGYLLP